LYNIEERTNYKMPPKKSYKNAKKPRTPSPKIYGFFKTINLTNDEDFYMDVEQVLQQDLVSIYPSFFKSIKISDYNKSGEIVGSFNLYLTEQAKDITQEQFNHIVRIINKQSEMLPYIKVFFVNTNEPQGVKYTYTNYVKNTNNTNIPNIFFFCEANDININSLKDQLKIMLKDDYMDFFAIKNKSKSEYNTDGGFFLKVRLHKEITEDVFKNTSELIRNYFNDNYSEDNIKTYYKTEQETNGKKYTFTHPNANKQPAYFIND
jgi:hypothetical protein